MMKAARHHIRSIRNPNLATELFQYNRLHSPIPECQRNLPTEDPNQRRSAETAIPAHDLFEARGRPLRGQLIGRGFAQSKCSGVDFFEAADCLRELTIRIGCDLVGKCQPEIAQITQRFFLLRIGRQKHRTFAIFRSFERVDLFMRHINPPTDPR